MTYSESRPENMEHQEVSALPTGRCVNLSLAEGSVARFPVHM